MKQHGILAARLLCIGLTGVPMMPARAAINSITLGASYNAKKTSLTCRVHSSQATRTTVYLYASGYGAQDVASYSLSSSVTASGR